MAVILMPVLPMEPSRPWRSLGGMLAFSRAWSAAEVMPAEDTPRIVSRQGSPCSLCAWAWYPYPAPWSREVESAHRLVDFAGPP